MHPLHLQEEWNGAGQMQLLQKDVNPEDTSGENTTMVLVPQIVDAVKIPVIAAGGIADGRGIAGSIYAGAKAVQMGTILLRPKNLSYMKNYKNADHQSEGH